jgi:predicted aspartyl protease
VDLDAWVDTAFTGELVLPEGKISDLGITQAAAVRAALGDGSEVVLNTYTCWVSWFGEEREFQAVGGERQVALLGVGLLRGRRLSIDYAGGDVVLE